MINYGANLTCIERKMAPLGEEESAVPPSQCAGTSIPRCRSKLVELGCKLLSHAPYSPDLVNVNVKFSS
jgi:hypothetical protein